MISDFLKLFQALKYDYEIIIFCENENLYKKIFKEYKVFFETNNIKTLLITYKSKIDKNEIIKKNYTNFTNFNHLEILKVFLKKIKNKIILTSTPTINKLISNDTNYFIFLQHTLGKISNQFTKKYMLNFDIITVSTRDQYNDTSDILTRNTKVIFNKYHNIDFIKNNELKIENPNKLETILIASSFFGNHMIKLIDVKFINSLVEKYNVILRPHPELYKDKEMVNKLKIFEKTIINKRFKISNYAESNTDVIRNSDYLITDFSGIALTFSYHKSIPSIFIINDNKDNILLYESFSKKTVEKIGYISEFNQEKILNIIKKIKNNKKELKEKIKNYCNYQLEEFNIKNNLKDYILNKLIKIT